MHTIRWTRWTALAVAALGCGQSADTVGDRNDLPPVQDTGWSTVFDACATEREEAVLLPTSLILAVDRSCSMQQPADPDETATTGFVSKWDETTDAFIAFFQDPDSATLDVALRLWPTIVDGCNEIECDPVDCAIPQVPLGSLADQAHRDALVDRLNSTGPDGGTPMHPALDGAIRWATARRAEAPGEEVAVVLVTDGEPRSDCIDDIDQIAGLAAEASASGIPVYAVGIEGSNVAQMDQIAAAGGTAEGYFIGSKNAEAELIAALKDIQSKQVSCSFAFPSESSGDPLSPHLVRVEYTVEGELVSVRRVADAAACGPDGGWYLDDPEQPTVITLCPSTCDALQGVATVSIEIDVGCECETDDDCPAGNTCTPEGCLPPCSGPDCAEATPFPVSGAQAVQGGAWRCASIPGPGALAGAIAALLVVGAGRRGTRRTC